MGIAGHVSLQIRGDKKYPAGTNLSLWPNADEDDVRYTGEVTSKLNNYGNFVLDAPALGMRKYKQDYKNEGKKHSDHVYVVKVNTENINQAAINLLRNKAYECTEQHFVLSDSFRWYAPGRGDVLANTLDPNKIYLNCASSVMLALLIGELDIRHVKPILTAKETLSNGLKLLEEIITRNQVGSDTSSLGELSEALKVILPGDIERILTSKTKAFFVKEVANLIAKNKKWNINANDRPIYARAIVKYLEADLKDETKSIKDILNQKRWIGLRTNRLKLPSELRGKN